MTFTDEEEAAIQAALPAYVEARSLIQARRSIRSKRGGGPGTFRGKTADEILADHGIVHGKSFTGDYERYGRVEAELRRRAQ